MFDQNSENTLTYKHPPQNLGKLASENYILPLKEKKNSRSFLCRIFSNPPWPEFDGNDHPQMVSPLMIIMMMTMMMMILVMIKMKLILRWSCHCRSPTPPSSTSCSSQQTLGRAFWSCHPSIYFHPHILRPYKNFTHTSLIHISFHPFISSMYTSSVYFQRLHHQRPW